MKYLIVICSILLTLGCSSSRIKDLNDIKVGMSKPAVLDIAGNPSRSSRIDGADRWSYDYWSGDAKKTLNVHFVEGKVTNISQANSTPVEEGAGFKKIGK